MHCSLNHIRKITWYQPVTQTLSHRNMWGVFGLALDATDYKWRPRIRFRLFGDTVVEQIYSSEKYNAYYCHVHVHIQVLQYYGHKKIDSFYRGACMGRKEQTFQRYKMLITNLLNLRKTRFQTMHLMLLTQIMLFLFGVISICIALIIIYMIFKHDQWPLANTELTSAFAQRCLFLTRHKRPLLGLKVTNTKNDNFNILLTKVKLNTKHAHNHTRRDSFNCKSQVKRLNPHC